LAVIELGLRLTETLVGGPGAGVNIRITTSGPTSTANGPLGLETDQAGSVD
jgi:hypothetical protein